MELRGGDPELVREKPLSLMEIFRRSAELVEAHDGGHPDYLDWVRKRAEARERAEAAAGFTGSALARAFTEAGREVSLIGIGELNVARPIWFPDAGDARTALVDANRYALGSSLVLAYDTEYQGKGERNEILSYQVCAFEPRGRWCEFIIHVKGG
jgi:hypothetical protein